MEILFLVIGDGVFPLKGPTACKELKVLT